MAISLGAAILGSALIGGGVAALSGSKQASSANKAANVQAKASTDAAQLQAKTADKTLALQKEIFDIQRGDFAPWREVGVPALGKINALAGMAGPEARQNAMADFRTDPGYEFAFGEGQRALERSAAARGRLLSGRTGKELVRYGTGMADQGYDRFYNRLAELAGVGQRASEGASNAASGYGANAGNTMMTGGNALAQGVLGAGSARASGYIGAGNAWSGAFNGIATAANQGIQNNMLLKYLPTLGSA